MDISIELFGDSDDPKIADKVIRYLCQKGNDTPTARGLLLNSGWAKFKYCRDILDLESVWRSIDDDYTRFMYCRYIEDRKQLWSKIRSEGFASMYCQRIKARPEVLKYASDAVRKEVAEARARRRRWKARREEVS